MIDQDADSRRIPTALELEQLARVKATEEIDEESRRAEETTVSDYASRGYLQSGMLGGRIAEIHRDRARRIVKRQIDLRRGTLQIAPEVASEERFKELLESAFATIDVVLRSIPEHLKRRGFQMAVDTVGQKDEIEAYTLKAEARREIDMLKPRSWKLNMTSMLSNACTRASPNGKAEARCPATSRGRTTFANASSPIEQSWDTVWTSRRRRLA